MSHQWVENSGTTMICCNCGCILYCCNCCTRGRPLYQKWSIKNKDWFDGPAKTTKNAPVCDPSRPVPEWLRGAKRQGYP